MALITKIVHEPLESRVSHTNAECTYDIVLDEGVKYLQLDTYGSNRRQIKGKKSQSLRLSPEAITQLKAILEKHGL
jgi:hypothetical protein